MNLLEIRNLSKFFGGLKAVSDVSFNLSKGEVLGIIGPNGAGKTTLFNLVSGAIKPDQGTILLKDEQITGMEPFEICRKGLTRTFQLCRPFRRLSVHHNVLVGAYKTTTDTKEAYGKADEILDVVGLQSKRDVMAESLNIVDRKRLELARAIATEPEVLLLDEVMSGLNPKELSDVLTVVKRVFEEGITVVLIEHVMRVVMSICNRIVVLNHGEKIAEGEPRHVMRDPMVIRSYLGEKRRHVSG